MQVLLLTNILLNELLLIIDELLFTVALELTDRLLFCILAITYDNSKQLLFNNTYPL
jgi:hypothetical protein